MIYGVTPRVLQHPSCRRAPALRCEQIHALWPTPSVSTYLGHPQALPLQPRRRRARTLRHEQIQVLSSLPSLHLHVRVLRMPALSRVAAALGVCVAPIWALLLWFSTSILRFPQYVFPSHGTTTKFFHSFLTIFCMIYHVQCEATMEFAACAHWGWPCNSSTIVKIRCVFDWIKGYNLPCTTYTLIIVDTISVILLKASDTD